MQPACLLDKTYKNKLKQLFKIIFTQIGKILYVTYNALLSKVRHSLSLDLISKQAFIKHLKPCEYM